MVKQIHMTCGLTFIIPQNLLISKFFKFACQGDDSRCKICKENEGEDWLGCDACGQYFHASCLNVDYGETLQDMFYCP